MSFIGMRGTLDWVNNQRPESWRQQILYLYPNGMAPLTAILSLSKGEQLTDPVFHWWIQEQNAISGAVSGIYTDSGLTTAYVSGATSGTVLYIKTSSTVINSVRVGHQILLRCSTDYRVDVNGKIVNVYPVSGATAIAVKLLENDDNSPSKDLSDCDNFKIIGNINPEGGEMPDAVALNPTEVYNYTQIFRTPLSITRTAKLTKLRTQDDYQKMKAEALEMHSWEMELAFLWGIRTQSIGDNGKPERTTMGIVSATRAHAPNNCDDYTLNTTYTSKKWTDSGGGGTWLRNMLERIFRYGSEEKLAFCGSGALLGLESLAMTEGTMNISPGEKVFGMRLREWNTPFGTIMLKTHPLMSSDETTRNMIIIVEPKELRYKYITDTTFYPDKSSGSRRVDGTNEEYLTECGLEYGAPVKFGILNGVGKDNTLT